MADEFDSTKSEEFRQVAHWEICLMRTSPDQSASVTTGHELVAYIESKGPLKPSWLLDQFHFLRELPNGDFYIGKQMSGMAEHDEALRVIKKLIQFYATVTPDAIADFKDLIQQAEDRLNAEMRSVRHSPKVKTKKPGYVYLIKSPTGYYKIGRSKNPNNRKKTFGVQLPFEVEFEHLIKTDDMETLETELHLYFSHLRVNGEWFDLSADDVAYIKSLDGVA